MSTLQITLSEELDRFVASKVKDGTCADASEVVNSALRLLEREEREYDEKMAALCAAIQVGLDSGVAEPGTFERIRQKYNLPQREACA
jgi:antitoxin ParD1/3/4